jgi:hypothetical protein
MALFTEADRDAVKTAMITAATEGIAQVSIGGQSVQAYSLDQLRKILEMMQAEIAADNTSGTGGMRFRKMVPGSTG